MEGSLEKTETDTFDYVIKRNLKFVANKKNGKSYFNFYEGIVSSAVNFRNYPGCPKNVRFLNSGKELPFKIETLDNYFDSKTGKKMDKYLHIYDIPVDEYLHEPPVIEIEW